jgi:hypothetical protein
MATNDKRTRQPVVGILAQPKGVIGRIYINKRGYVKISSSPKSDKQTIKKYGVNEKG